jgi:hypothetical protein
MGSAYDEKIREGARPFLEEGEEVVASIIARPRGWTQTMAGSLHLGSHQQGAAKAGAQAAGFELASPMALALTDRRLLSLELGSTPGMGAGGEVKRLAGALPLADVDEIRVKRLLLGKVVTVVAAGQEFKLEANAKADAHGLAETFTREKEALATSAR